MPRKQTEPSASAKPPQQIEPPQPQPSEPRPTKDEQQPEPDIVIGTRWGGLWV